MSYIRQLKKLYDLGKREYVDEKLPYKVVRGAWKGTLDVANKVVSNYVVEAGKQLKILFLRVWTEYSGGATFKITQTAQTGDLGSAPSGTVDYPFLEAAGAEVIGPVPLNSPIHVLEGSIDFIIQDPLPSQSTTNKFGLVWWGIVD